jgi:hypothetical protein
MDGPLKIDKLGERQMQRPDGCGGSLRSNRFHDSMKSADSIGYDRFVRLRRDTG